MADKYDGKTLSVVDYLGESYYVLFARDADPQPQECPNCKSELVFKDFSVWRLDIGDYLEPEIQFCPICGVKLDDYPN